MPVNKKLMTTTSLIQRQIVLRHRTAGYVRFDLPGSLCRDNIAAILEWELREIEGVYRVNLYRRARKLSIRYLDTVCDLRDIARKLSRAIEMLERHGSLAAVIHEPTKPAGARQILVGPIEHLRARYRQLKARATLFSEAFGSQVKGAQPLLRRIGSDPEAMALNFANDLVTFYLIKVHWNLIVKHWLKQPLTHRYEWLTVFYLVFLLVRSRRSGSPK